MSDNANSRRWYDSTRVILALAGVVAVLVGIIASTVWATVSSSRDRIDILERKGERLDEKLDAIGRDIREIKEELRKHP